jgi:hypothetical protein
MACHRDNFTFLPFTRKQMGQSYIIIIKLRKALFLFYISRAFKLVALTSKFCIVTKFCNFHCTENAHVTFVGNIHGIYLFKFHMNKCNGSLVIAIKRKGK